HAACGGFTRSRSGFTFDHKEEMHMLNLRKCFIGAATVGLCATAAMPVHAKDLTLCWAAWDPANALVELSKDFTAKTGIAMKFEFVPWPNFADRFIHELNSKSDVCD